MKVMLTALLICSFNAQSLLVKAYSVEEVYKEIDSVEETVIDKNAEVTLISTGKIHIDEKTGNKFKVGKWVDKIKAGPILSAYNYSKKGVQEGIQIEYGIDGKIKYKWEMVNGLKNGILTAYYPSSEKVMLEAEYKDDELNGASIFYNIDGSIKERKMYKEGEQVEK